MQKGFKILLWAIYAFIIPSLSYAQQTVGLFTKNNGQQDGYVLFSPNSSDITYLIDKCGKLVHKWNTGSAPGLDAYILPNGNLLSTGKVVDPYFNSVGSAGGMLKIFDWNQNLIWSYKISDSISHQDHDVFPMPNGDILVCEWERITNAEAIAAGRDSAKLAGSNIWSAKIQEIKPLGTDSAQVVWQWRLWDHLVQDKDSAKPNFGVVVDHPELLNVNYVDSTETNAVLGDSDWIHANSVAYNPDLDQVVISARSLSEFWIIDHSTTTAQAASHSGGTHNKGGDFLYRWGNPAAYNRAFPGSRTLYLQHDVSWIPDGLPGAGHITIFNNGTGRPGGNFSSADEIILPVDGNGNYSLGTNNTFGPDSSIWSYKAPIPTNVYSSTQGSVQRLPNGNTLICEADSGIFFELDTNKSIVWKYVNPDGGYGAVSQGQIPKNIACFRANMYLESNPAFQNITLNPGSPVELNPYNYDCYMSYLIHAKPLYTISQIKSYNTTSGIADSINTYCYLKGVVQTDNLSITNSELYTLQDSTGAITINSSEFLDGYTPNLGDSIVVRGKVNQTNGLTYFQLDSVSLLTPAFPIASVMVTTLNESVESKLVTLQGYALIDSTKWDTTGANGSFDVLARKNGDTITMKILSSTNLYLNSAKPNGYFNVTGIEGQNDSTNPYFSGYYIIPRSVQDISNSASLPSENEKMPKIDIFPNPAQNTINIASTADITGIEITDILGKNIFSQKDLHISNKTFDISTFKKGVYVLKISSHSDTIISKMIKE